MIAAGALRDRAVFQRRPRLVSDEGTLIDGEWSDLVTVWSQLAIETGREVLAAGRLTARTAAILRVRTSSATRQVATTDRVVVRGDVWAIHSIREPDPGRGVLEMIIEQGAPT
jgi:head-tail adaptor